MFEINDANRDDTLNVNYLRVGGRYIGTYLSALRANAILLSYLNFLIIYSPKKPGVYFIFNVNIFPLNVVSINL